MKIKLNKRSRKAFSLVEILFVVIIIGVLTAVAVPSLFSQKGKADDSNAKQSLKVAEQLITTITMSDGTIDTTTTLDAQLGNASKNISFTGDATPSAATGNRRNISVLYPVVANGSNYAVMVALGGKNKSNNSTTNCWYVAVDPSGANPTAYGQITGTCRPSSVPTTFPTAPTATNTVNPSTGDFPGNI